MMVKLVYRVAGQDMVSEWFYNKAEALKYYRWIYKVNSGRLDELSN